MSREPGWWERPHPGLALSGSAALIQDLHPCFIHLHDVIAEDIVLHQVDQGLNQLTAFNYPVGHGAAVDLNAYATKDGALPV